MKWSVIRLQRALSMWLVLVYLGLGVVSCARLECKVKGTVTHKGKALTEGTVNFYAPEKGVASKCQLDGSGNFDLRESLPPGIYKVYFLAPPPQQLPPGSVALKHPPYPLLPKYQDPGQTPLKHVVKAGENDIKIEITD